MSLRRIIWNQLHMWAMYIGGDHYAQDLPHINHAANSKTRRKKKRKRKKPAYPSQFGSIPDGCSSGTIAIGTDPDSCTLAQRPPREPHHVLEHAEFQNWRPGLKSRKADDSRKLRKDLVWTITNSLVKRNDWPGWIELWIPTATTESIEAKKKKKTWQVELEIWRFNFGPL